MIDETDRKGAAEGIVGWVVDTVGNEQEGVPRGHSGCSLM